MQGYYEIGRVEQGPALEKERAKLLYRVCCQGVISGVVYCEDLEMAKLLVLSLQQRERLQGYGQRITQKEVEVAPQEPRK